MGFVLFYICVCTSHFPGAVIKYDEKAKIFLSRSRRIRVHHGEKPGHQAAGMAAEQTAERSCLQQHAGSRERE